MSVKQQKLVLSIIEFLTNTIRDGTVKQDDREGVEVAVQCIGEAFGVDTSNAHQVEQLTLKPATLQSIFDAYLNTRDQATATSSDEQVINEEDKVEAESLKQAGNALMTSRKYNEAIEAYTKAISKYPTNSVYYSNRAAAYSSKNDHTSAITDAEKAIDLEPSFVKAYHRLGHAYYSLGDFQNATAAFQRGLDVEPSNQSLKVGLQNAQARMPSTSQSGTGLSNSRSNSASATEQNAGSMADMHRREGGQRGFPDLSSIMNNPAMMQMAQQMMANGGLEGLMQNPAIRNIVNQFQSGENSPSLAEMMADPSLRDIAGQYLGRDSSGN